MSVETALHSLLTGDATLRGLCVGGIYQMEAPPGTEPPFLVWQKVLGRDTEHTFTRKVSDDDEYQFFAWAEDTAELEGVAAADQILERLELVTFDAALNVSPRTLLHCRKLRNLPPQKDTMEGGVTRYGKGQQWRIEVS